MMIFDMFSICIYFRIVINPAISLMICKRSCFVFSNALKMKFSKWMAILESRLKLIFPAAECKNRMKNGSLNVMVCGAVPKEVFAGNFPVSQITLYWKAQVDG